MLSDNIELYMSSDFDMKNLDLSYLTNLKHRRHLGNVSNTNNNNQNEMLYSIISDRNNIIKHNIDNLLIKPSTNEKVQYHFEIFVTSLLEHIDEPTMQDEIYDDEDEKEENEILFDDNAIKESNSKISEIEYWKMEKVFKLK